jgi:hypothetical protein
VVGNGLGPVAILLDDNVAGLIKGDRQYLLGIEVHESLARTRVPVAKAWLAAASLALDRRLITNRF